METALVFKHKMKVSAVFSPATSYCRDSAGVCGGLFVFVCLLFHGEGSKELFDVMYVSTYMRFRVHEFHYSLSF